MGAGEGKRGVKGDQHFPMHADHTHKETNVLTLHLRAT